MRQYLFSGFSLKNKRSSNMDSLLLKHRTLKGTEALLAVVCDGVGSLEDGAFASGTAVRMLNDWFDQINGMDRLGLRLRDMIFSIHKQIAAQAVGRGFQTASTLSALLFADSQYYMVHIGDSRVYMYDQALSVLTTDDVSENGKLTGYIGRQNDIQLQYGEGHAGGKTFLVCSDGLYKRVPNNVIAEKMQVRNERTVKEAVKSLIGCALGQGESDNISIALVRIER